MTEVTSRELTRKYKGFIQDPDALINQIIDNLRDRYQTGFPVIKELVQKADDGRAEKSIHVSVKPPFRSKKTFFRILISYAYKHTMNM